MDLDFQDCFIQEKSSYIRISETDLDILGHSIDWKTPFYSLINMELDHMQIDKVHLVVACGVYGDVFLCCPFSHEVSWMRS